MDQNKKKDLAIKILIGITAFVLFVFGGLLFAESMKSSYRMSIPAFLLYLAALCVSVFISIFLQIFLHEAGHLIAGLASGYRFVSFRVFSLILVRRGKRFFIYRYSLPGTGGQCLMAPKADFRDFRYHFFMMGGVLMNLCTGLLILLILFFTEVPFLVLIFLFSLAAVGIVSFLTNAMPLKMQGLMNDGMQLRMMRGNEAYRRSVYYQLKLYEALVEGERPKEMPASWFCWNSAHTEMPEETAFPGIEWLMAGERFSDQEKFREAKICLRIAIRNLSEDPVNRIAAQLSYAEKLIFEGAPKESVDEVLRLETEEEKVIRNMLRKTELSFVYFYYLYALAYQTEKVEERRLLFENRRKNCPTLGNVRSIDAALALYEKLQTIRKEDVHN